MAAVVVVFAALPSATMLTVFGVEMVTKEPETASWASLGTDTCEALATPSSVTSPSTVGEVVLMVRSAPSRLTLTALARLTLMTDPSCTWASSRRRHPVGWLQFNLGTLDDLSDGSAEGLDGADFAVHVECDRLVVADEGHEAQHQCHEHHELRADLDEADLAVRCEELDHDCPNLLDHPGTGKSARNTLRERAKGGPGPGPERHRSCVHCLTQNESAHVVRLPRCTPCWSEIIRRPSPTPANS